MINWELEQAERDMLFSMAKDGDVLYDIGANEGMYSLDFAKRFPNNESVAFEPVPGAYIALDANARGMRIAIYPFALSDKYEAKVPMYLSKFDSGASSLSPLEEERFGENLMCYVQVRTLDDVIERTHNIAKPSIIKCDVEGAELLVFLGANRTLKTHHPIIQCEMHRKWMARFKHHPNDLIRYMADLNYSCYALCDGKLEPFAVMLDSTPNTNFYFLPNKESL